jgi:mannose-6-phosphate isomerase-like protein (cupin superfamily)
LPSALVLVCTEPPDQAALELIYVGNGPLELDADRFAARSAQGKDLLALDAIRGCCRGPFTRLTAGNPQDMPYPGQEISNPITGERVVFRHTTAETGGEFVDFELALRPLGAVAGVPHRHPQHETFHVSGGRFAGWIEGEGTISASAGDEVRIPPWREHLIFNGGLGYARALVEVRPGAKFDEFLKTVFELAALRRPDGHNRVQAVKDAVKLANEVGFEIAFLPGRAQPHRTELEPPRGHPASPPHPESEDQDVGTRGAVA